MRAPLLRDTSAIWLEIEAVVNRTAHRRQLEAQDRFEPILEQLICDPSRGAFSMFGGEPNPAGELVDVHVRIPCRL
jgi:hypothetical protein